MIEQPRDIRTGEPLFDPETWERLSESEKRLACYHNSPHKQRTGELYRAIAAQQKPD
jgi:hypothetical protein